MRLEGWTQHASAIGLREINLSNRLKFNLLYLFGSPRWDTGMVPPEVLEFVESNHPGRALDLGCGTGTNMVYLAQHGWQVDGIDFSWLAVLRARRRLRIAGLPPSVWAKDVTRWDITNGNYNYILDIGCYHQLPAAGKQSVQKFVLNNLASDGCWMIYGHRLDPEGSRLHGLSEQDITDLSNTFTLIRREDGQESGRGPSVWLWFEGKVL